MLIVVDIGGDFRLSVLMLIYSISCKSYDIHNKSKLEINSLWLSYFHNHIMRKLFLFGYHNGDCVQVTIPYLQNIKIVFKIAHG